MSVVNDPRMFKVTEKAYGQVDAASRVNALNCAGGPPQDKPAAKSAQDDEDEDFERASHARATHGPVRHRGGR